MPKSGRASDEVGYQRKRHTTQVLTSDDSDMFLKLKRRIMICDIANAAFRSNVSLTDQSESYARYNALTLFDDGIETRLQSSIACPRSPLCG